MKVNTLQFLNHFALSSTFILIPLFAKVLRATDFEVGMVGVAYGSAVFVASYIFGRASDIYGRRIFLLAGLLVSSLAFILQIFAFNAFSLIIARFIVGFCTGVYPPSLIAYVAESKRRLGKFVSYGSLGMGAGTFVAGIIGIYWQVFLLGSLLFIIAFLIALTLEETRKGIMYVPLFPKKILKENLPVYSAFFLRHTGASAVWIIFPIYLSVLGAGKEWIGAIYALNAGSQFVSMQMIDKFKSSKLVVCGLLCSGITFISFFLAQNFYYIFALQLLLGFSWACLYVGSLKFVTERTLEKATSSGLLNSAISLSAIIGPFLGGTLAQLLGYRNVILFAVFMCFTALGIFRFTLGVRK